MHPEPIPNIWLSVGDDAVKTDADGKWAITNVPADPVEVSLLLTHADYVSDAGWGGLQKEQGITTAALRDGKATIVMHRGIAVTGTVTDPDGKPVPEAMIVWGDDPYFEWGSQETRTDKEGKYKTPPLAYGPMTMTVVAEGFAPQQERIELPAQIAVFFKLAAGKPLRIHFIDETGAPVPDVRVGIGRWRHTLALFNHKHPNVLDSKIPRQANKDGLYEWTWAPDDEVTLSFYKEGFRAVESQAVTAGNLPLSVKLELRGQPVIQRARRAASRTAPGARRLDHSPRPFGRFGSKKVPRPTPELRPANYLEPGEIAAGRGRLRAAAQLRWKGEHTQAQFTDSS